MARLKMGEVSARYGWIIEITPSSLEIYAMVLKRCTMTSMCAIVAVSALILAGCAGFPETINYSVYDDGFETSSETVQYGSGGPKIVSESGLSPEVASGFKEAQDLKEFGLDVAPYSD